MTQSSFINIVYVIFFPPLSNFTSLLAGELKCHQMPARPSSSAVPIGFVNEIVFISCWVPRRSVSALFLCCVVLLLYTVFPLIKYEKSTLSHEIDCGSAGAWDGKIFIGTNEAAHLTSSSPCDKRDRWETLLVVFFLFCWHMGTCWNYTRNWRSDSPVWAKLRPLSYTLLSMSKATKL